MSQTTPSPPPVDAPERLLPEPAFVSSGASWWRSTAWGIAGVVAFLASALVTGALAWLLPGQGLAVVFARVLLGAWVPGVAALGLQRPLRRRGRGALATGLLVGACLVGLALGGIAYGVAKGFRVI